MCQRRRWASLPLLYSYGILCSGVILSGCSTTGGNYDLGRADAQIQTLSERNPELAEELRKIRDSLKSASDVIAEKEKTIDSLAKRADDYEKKSEQRLALIWKLTSAILALTLGAGAYLAWKLK